MADVPAQAILNEAALKRFDPYVKEILDTAKYVALYRFNEEENEWEKTDVEGSLFVYSRTGQPFHNVLVLNRLNRNNLVEPITADLDLQLQEPFLLYRNCKLRIFGIWFYEKEECTRLARLIKDLMKQAGGNNKSSDKSVKVNGGPNVDLYSMLTKAQAAYNNNVTTKDLGNKLSPQDVDATPISVMEFFAKAQAPTKSTSRTVRLGENQSGLESSEKIKPLLHQIMSNPVHSVEHIEKQQRSVTPQAADKTLNLLGRPLSSGKITDADSQLESRTLENGRLKYGVSNLEDNMSRLNFNAHSEVRPYSAPHSVLETPEKLSLMPPAMFTPSAREGDLPESTNQRPEPLTKNQLLQALNYLLKNDPDFMTKIHEAYVKSLMDMVV